MLGGKCARRGRIVQLVVIAALAGLGAAPAGQAAVTSESTFGTGAGIARAQTTSSDQVNHQNPYNVPQTSGPTSIHLTSGQATADQTSSFGQAHAEGDSSEDETVAIDSQSTHVTWSSSGSVAASLHPAGHSSMQAFGSDGAIAGLRFTIDAPASYTLSGSESGQPFHCPSVGACGDPITLFSVGQGNLATPVAQIQVGAPETTLTGTLPAGSYFVQGHTAAEAEFLANDAGPDQSGSATMSGHFDFKLSAGSGCPAAHPVSSVKAGQVLAEGCFVERKDSKGNGTGVFETDEQAWVGGFEVDPAFGGKFVVDTKTPALSEEGAGVDVKIDGTTTPIEVGDLPINTTDGTLDLNQAGSAATAAKALLNLPVKGKLKVSWSDGGRSSGLDGEVSLKAAFSNFIVATNSKGSEGEFKFKLKQTNKTGLVVNQASAKIDEVALIPKKFKVPNQFVLHNLTATYDRKNGKPLWSFGGLLGIPLKDGPLDIGGRFFWSDGPAGGGISVDGIDKELGGTPFFLQKLDGDLVFKPDFGVNATVGVTFGPRVDGKQIAVLEGNLASGVLVSSSDCPNGLDPFKIEGKVKLAKLDFTTTLIKLEGTERTCTYAGPIKGADAAIKLTAEVATSTGLTLMGVEATTSGFIGQTGFNEEGTATLKVPGVPAITGSMIFSNQGIAACGKFNAAFQAGIGYRWGGSPPSLFTGCDLSPFRTTALPAGDGRARAAAASRTLSVRAGLPVAAFSARAAGRAPRIRVSGPHGESFSSAASGATINNRVVIIPDQAEDTTYIVVTRPAAGRWTVQSLDPAVSLTRVGIANGLPRPHVTGRLKRHGSKLTLSYTVRPIPGQHVAFAERGAGGVFHTIGSARGHRGRITFRPTIAFKRNRVIVAQVTENGLPRATITVARFTAPAVPRLSKPKHLTAHRKATTLTISWSPVAQARTYLIKVFQGRTLIATTLTTHHALRLIGVPGQGVLTVNVQAVGAIRKPGPAARATVR